MPTRSRPSVGPRPPAVLYHVSRHPSPLSALAPLSHLGVLQAARERAVASVMVGHPRTCYRVRLEVQRPALVSDYDWGGHSWARLVDDLHYTRRLLSGAERSAVFAAGAAGGDAAAAQALAAMLGARGYDGLVYHNAHEARGTASWVCLHPEQTEILDALDWGRLSEAERFAATRSLEGLAAHWARSCPDGPELPAPPPARALQETQDAAPASSPLHPRRTARRR